MKIKEYFYSFKWPHLELRRRDFNKVLQSRDPDPKFCNPESRPEFALKSQIPSFKYDAVIKRLVFTSDGVGVGVGSRKRGRKSAYDLVKIKREHSLLWKFMNRSRKRSYKRDGIGVRRIVTYVPLMI